MKQIADGGRYLTYVVALGLSTEMPASPPSRALVIVAGLLTQLIGAACLVVGLASIPMVHDAHAGNTVLIGWIVAAFAALICGGLSYRGRLVPLFVASLVDAAFGFVLPRGDSAFGVVAQLLPKGDIPEAVVMYVPIAMFVIAALCLAAVPFAYRYRAWWLTSDEPGASRSIIKPSDTLKGIGAGTSRAKIILDEARSQPWVIFTVAVTLTGVGVAVILEVDKPAPRGSAEVTQGTQGDPAKPEVATKPVEARKADPAKPDPTKPDPSKPVSAAATPQLLAKALNDAIERGDGDIASIVGAEAFAFGIDAAEVATTRDAVLAIAARDLHADAGSTVDVKLTAIGTDGSMMWLDEEVALSGRTLAISGVGHEDHGAWTLAALCIARPLADAAASHLVKTGQLRAPAPVPAATNALATTAKDAFASKTAFVAARSTRADAFNFGSAGERITDGNQIKRAFSHLPATLVATGGIAAGLLGERAGWTAQDVEFTLAGQTQAFRVLAAWIHEDAGWRMVMTQWSNGGPFP